MHKHSITCLVLHAVGWTSGGASSLQISLQLTSKVFLLTATMVKMGN